MGRFRKKPVTIEAVQFTGGVLEAVFSEHPDWLLDGLGRDEAQAGAVWFEPGWSPPVLQIHTLEGTHRAEPGDWIIRGVKGELYPCKPDIFAATYDQVWS